MSALQESNKSHWATAATSHLPHSMVVQTDPILRFSVVSLHSPVARVFRVRRQKLSLRAALRLCRESLQGRSQLTVRRDRGLLSEQINRFDGLCFVPALPPIV